MKPKQQRLVLGIAALIAVGGAGFLALSGLKDKASFFYSPSDIAREGIPQGQARLGGMVKVGSLSHSGVNYSFIVADGPNEVPVRFTGIAPDLFKEGSGVVADGKFEGKTFVAETILAKHDERYMPPQMAGKQHKTTTLAGQ